MLIFPRWHVLSLSRSGVSCAKLLFHEWNTSAGIWMEVSFKWNIYFSLDANYKIILFIKLVVYNLHYISCRLHCASYGKITKWWDSTIKKKYGTYLPSSEDDNKILNSAHSQAIGQNSTRNLWVTKVDVVIIMLE